jgi:hypothetical protein
MNRSPSDSRNDDTPAGILLFMFYCFSRPVPSGLRQQLRRAFLLRRLSLPSLVYVYRTDKQLEGIIGKVQWRGERNRRMEKQRCSLGLLSLASVRLVFSIWLHNLTAYIHNYSSDKQAVKLITSANSCKVAAVSTELRIRQIMFLT